MHPDDLQGAYQESWPDTSVLCPAASPDWPGVKQEMIHMRADINTHSLKHTLPFKSLGSPRNVLVFERKAHFCPLK